MEMAVPSMENSAAAEISRQQSPAAMPVLRANADCPRKLSVAESRIERKEKGRTGILGVEGWLPFFCNLGWSGANQVTRALLITFVVILVTRHLGPSAYGSLALGLSIVKIGIIGAGLGLGRILVQELVLEPESTSNIMKTGLLLKGLAGLLSYMGAILFVAIFLPNQEVVRLVVMIAGFAILLQAFDTLDYRFQARGQMKLSFLGRTIPTVLASLLKVAAVMAGANLLTFATLEAVEAVLISAGLALVYWKTAGIKDFTIPSSPSASGRSPSTLLYDGLPLLISGVAVIIYQRIDLIMLSMMIGGPSTGIYAAAAQVSEIWNVIPLALAPAVFPVILRAKALSAEMFEHRFLAILQSMSLGAILIVCFVTVCASSIVNVLYGPAFANSADILRVHIWSIFFVFLGMTQTLWDAGEKLYWLTCFRTAAGALCNVGLNLILIPEFGALGAAIATLISYAVAAFLLNAATQKTMPLFTMQLKSLILIPLIGWLRHCRRCWKTDNEPNIATSRD